MTPQLIAIDAGAFKDLLSEVRELKAMVQAARIQPAQQWLTVREYAAPKTQKRPPDRLGRAIYAVGVIGQQSGRTFYDCFSSPLP